jgi:hypothetical protein
MNRFGARVANAARTARPQCAVAHAVSALSPKADKSLHRSEMTKRGQEETHALQHERKQKNRLAAVSPKSSVASIRRPALDQANRPNHVEE